MHKGIVSDRLELMAGRFISAAYAATSDDTIDWSPLFNEFNRVPTVVDERREDSLPGYGALDDGTALSVASSVSCGVHARLNHAFMHATGPEIDVGQRLSELGVIEAEYNRRLDALRTASLNQEGAQAESIYQDMIADVDTLDDLLLGVGLLRVADRRIGNLGLRCSDLARHFSMLIAGAIQVMRRLSTGPGAAGMKRIASNRQILRRYDTAQWEATVPLAGLEEGSNQVVMGEIRETGWISRPDTPYSFLRLTDGAELRIHRRDIKQNGVIPGSITWVRGKVEVNSEGNKVLIAHFEGPGTHASSIWEDWLADEVRAAYDLYPRVIDANWEFPSLGVRYSGGDLISRVGGW